MYFGEKLRILRKKNKWTQNELAKKIGLHGRLIGKYENGEVTPNAETVIKIAKVFHTSIDYLLLDENVHQDNGIQDTELLQLFREVDKMQGEDKYIIKSLIDAYLKKKKLETIMV